VNVPKSIGSLVRGLFCVLSTRKRQRYFALLAFIAGLVTLTLLRANLAIVTALHSHMIDDSPHLFFMHFWANDDVTKLTRGLRAALDLANIKHGT
jgi:Domain of Unknown Function (DUF1259)